MSRSATPYAEREVRAVSVAGSIDVTTPVEGCYRYRLGRDTVRGAVRLWYGPPCDPLDREVILDRSWRWQAEFQGEAIDFNRVWPACAADSLTAEEYRHYLARQDWAREHAPDSAYAEPGRRHDPLSSSSPLPF